MGISRYPYTLITVNQKTYAQILFLRIFILAKLNESKVITICYVFITTKTHNENSDFRTWKQLKFVTQITYTKHSFPSSMNDLIYLKV